MLKGSFSWKRIVIPKLLLHHVTALLVMQGMKLQDLFQVDTVLRQVALPREGEVFGRGLHLLLAGELSPTYRMPISIKNVTLAHLEFPLPDISREDLLRELMEHR